MTPSQLIISILTVICIKGVHLSKEKQVFQAPADWFAKPNTEVKLNLTHHISTYDTVLWYKRSTGDNALKLIGYVRYKKPTMEPEFEGHFDVSGDGEKAVFLHILNPRHPEDSAEYFGAANIVLSSPVIQQSPENLLIKSGQDETRLGCYHGNNDYPYMLWYQYKSVAGGQRAMKLIGLLHYEKENIEKDSAGRFNITGHSKGRAQLVISNINQDDTAEYFCAASKHSVATPLVALQKAGGR
ncbi:hypothetical protein INR49_031458 [Caranx melampygus]|nr:hypothetical protein INR49_031458 [Caranx melampygus]